MTSLSGIVNSYSKVVSIGTDAQASTLVLASPVLSVEDRVLVVQMQGASISLSNDPSFGVINDLNGAGLFAWAKVSAVEGPNVRLDRVLPAGFDVGGSVQVVKVPAVVEDATVTGTLEAPPWNGETGGVVALDVPGTLSLAADVEVSGLGFSGGRCSNNDAGLQNITDYFIALPPPPATAANDAGTKGDGITFVDTSKRAGRGAPANGGGGGHAHNAGGGGGGNGGAGGQGGWNWSDINQFHDIGGRGGRALRAAGRAFLGGGGGGGQQNNSVGTAGSAGGGLVIVRARKIDGSSLPGGGKPTIRANGAAGGGAENDGGGGGGAGGTILLDAEELGGALRLEAHGGAGGGAWGGHGPGGGGGGGEVRSTMDIVFPSGFEFDVAWGPAGGGHGAASGEAGVCPEKRLSIGARSLTVFPGYEGALVVTLRNTGVTTLAVTSLAVAQIPWIALPPGAALPNALGPGEEVQVVMAVAVPADVSLGAVDTSIVVAAAGATFSAPLHVEITAAPGQNLRVLVRNRQTGAPIPNAAVAIDTSPGLFHTNHLGELLLTVPAGRRELDAVAPGYLPNGTMVDCGDTLATAELELLAGQPLVTGVTAQGYPNTEGSSWVYDFTVSTGLGQVHLGGVPVSTAGGGNTVTVPFGPTNVTGGAGGTVTGQVIFFRPEGSTAAPHTWPQVWIVIPGGIRVLKDFFDILVYVHNHTAGYNFTNVRVIFDEVRPAFGVPLFASHEQSFPVMNLHDVPSGSHASARLIVRGDIPGRHRIKGNISANLVLNSNGTSVALASPFETQEIVVALPQFDVSFDIFPRDEDIVAGQLFEFRVHITNRSTLPMQGVEVFLDQDRLVNCSPSTPNPPLIRLGTIAGSYPGATQSRDAIFTLRSQVTGRVLHVSHTLSSTPTSTTPGFAPVVDAKPNAQPDVVKTYSGQPVEVPVLPNDTDPEGKPLRIVGVTQGAGGSVIIDAEGKVIYTPSDVFVGMDSFKYTIADPGGQTAEATVSVDVRTNPLALELGVTSVQGGLSVSGNAFTRTGSKFGVTKPPIYLTSSHPTVQVPASIPDPGSFTVTTTMAGSQQEVTITAASGAYRRSQTLVILATPGDEIPGPTDPMPMN